MEHSKPLSQPEMFRCAHCGRQTAIGDWCTDACMVIWYRENGYALRLESEYSKLFRRS